MRSLLWAILLGVVLAPSSSAEGWAIESTLGLGVGSDFTRPAPFVSGGALFEGPYRTCDPSLAPPLPAFPDAPDVVRCRVALAWDVRYTLQERFIETGFLRLSIRRQLGRSLALDAGALGGLAAKRERVFVTPMTGQVDLSRPMDPSFAVAAILDPRNSGGRYTGVGSLLYLYADLRYERSLDTRDELGRHPSAVTPFLALGAGILPTVPGGADAAIGTVPGLHAEAGVRFRRRPSPDLTLSLLHVSALNAPPGLVGSHLSWRPLPWASY